MSNAPPLDLHDIALLLNYERASTEPRFRHAKLREIATSSSNFQSVTMIEEWHSRKGPKEGFLFETSLKAAQNSPDLPSNMFPTPVPVSLRGLTPRQIETIYWQVRGHDGCYQAVALLQHFFELYPANTSVRVHTSDGVDFVTLAANMTILEMKLQHSKLLTYADVMNKAIYTTGEDPVSSHTVLRFSGGNNVVVLDLASMQFGDAGRGLRDHGTFVLESLDDFTTRLQSYARKFTDVKISYRMRPPPPDIDAWLAQAARRVKQRLGKKKKEPWCTSCGTPVRRGSTSCAFCASLRPAELPHGSPATGQPEAVGNLQLQPPAASGSKSATNEAPANEAPTAVMTRWYVIAGLGVVFCYCAMLLNAATIR
ncbi:hypothetical protein C8J57DRAFT_1175036 [Mycena rebaudengoi]|nr:hypothetical protein C8J57DRAFT_1175036 [Mycena rebaudengoi]